MTSEEQKTVGPGVLRSANQLQWSSLRRVERVFNLTRLQSFAKKTFHLHVLRVINHNSQGLKRLCGVSESGRLFSACICVLSSRHGCTSISSSIDVAIETAERLNLL